jgi:hypothetical protein
MLGRNDSESVEPLGGRLGAVCTAKASGISRKAVQSGCACEWGGWGRLSVDGAGQNNPVWSEGPWGRAAAAARTEVLQRTTSPGTERGTREGSGEHEGQWQTVRGEEASNGKALSDLPALQPYWGKPAVRNFREGNGNVGIIRSPLRAFALPDQSCGFKFPVTRRNIKGRLFWSRVWSVRLEPTTKRSALT